MNALQIKRGYMPKQGKIKTVFNVTEDNGNLNNVCMIFMSQSFSLSKQSAI